MRPQTAPDPERIASGATKNIRISAPSLQPQLIEAEDATLGLDHEGRVIEHVVGVERELGATGFHERRVVAPGRLRGQGETGQRGGIGRVGTPNTGGVVGVRAGQRRWYCLLPNMISQASLSVL